MPIDSAASLLFQIKANPDDAKENISRFRSLLSTDMASMKTQIGQWTEELFGSAEKVKASHEQVIAAIEKEKAARLANAKTAEETAAIEEESTHKVAEAQEQLNSKLKMVGSGWGSIAAVAGSAVMALGAGLFETAKKTAELGEQIGNLHDETGLSVQMISALRVRSAETGISFDQLGITVETLARNLSPYVRQTSMAARAAHDLGVSAYDANGHLKTMDQMLLSVMDAMHKTGVGAKNTAAAVSFLSTSGAKMIPIFMGGSAAMKEAIQRTQAMAQMFTTEGVESSEKFLQSFRDIKFTVEGLGITIGQKVMPYITSAMQGAASFLIAHSKDITEAISGLGQVFGWLTWVVEKTFDSFEAFGSILQRSAVAAVEAAQVMTDAIHGRFGAVKLDFAAMKENVIETWQDIKGSFNDSAGAGAGDFMKALGETLAQLGKKTAMAQQATDKFADSLINVRQQIEAIQDEESKPSAAIEAQFTRAKQAADREMASYEKLARAGKISRGQLATYEQEYHALVLSLAQERDLKLQQVAQHRVQSIEQLDSELESKIETGNKKTLQSRLAEINKEIAAETQKYQKLGALDMQHIEMLNQLRAHLTAQAVQAQAQQDAKSAQAQASALNKEDNQFAAHFKRLTALSDSYYQRTLSPQERIVFEYQRQVQQIKNLEAELLREAQTEQQRQQIVEQANRAISAARTNEQRQLQQFGEKSDQIFSKLDQTLQKHNKVVAEVAKQIEKAVMQELAAHEQSAAGEEKAAAKKTLAQGKQVGQVSVWQAALNIAKGIADLADFNFSGAAQHFAAGAAFASLAASVGLAVASMVSGGGGSSSRGSHDGRHSGGTSSRGGHGHSGSGGGSPAPVVNVHIDGMISADNLQQVMGQISGLVSSGSATLPASHLVVNGATVPAGTVAA